MFERYTEDARRVLFFACGKTVERDGDVICEEDVLAGMLMASPEMVARFATPPEDISTKPSEDFLSRLLEDATWQLRASQGIPFSDATKTVLMRACEEADQLGHEGIRPEHLLLGMLRDETSEAWRTLNHMGVTLREVRRVLAGESSEER